MLAVGIHPVVQQVCDKLLSMCHDLCLSGTHQCQGCNYLKELVAIISSDEYDTLD